MSPRREAPRGHSARQLVSLMRVAAELRLGTETVWTRLRRAGITIHRTRVGNRHVSAIARADVARLATTLPAEPAAPEPSEPEALAPILLDVEEAATNAELSAVLAALEAAKERLRTERAKNHELETRLSDLRADLRNHAVRLREQREAHAERFAQMARGRTQLHRTIRSQQRTLGRLEDELRDLAGRLDLRERIYRNNQRYIDRLEDEGSGAGQAAARRSA